ncbi:MAG TPA: GNAT family N-acetyltransferase [Thermoanaerobaculia bacterium]|nr:GNAT family N-acetyltransferase [Thermoanaerobaculia bacterium]
MNVRPARPEDRHALAILRATLWTDGTVAEHAGELEQILGGTWESVYPYVIFVAEHEGEIVGFVEVSMRSSADDCDPRRPVGYLEGWFVSEEQRRKGVGAALVRAAEAWARMQGCTEMASDTWLDSEPSRRAHEALGFEEVDRVINFRKALFALLIFVTLAARADVILHNVTVIDGGTRAAQDVVMRGDRILSVAPHAKHAPGAEVVDGSGRFVIPGLVDMHVHVLLHPWNENGDIEPRFDRDASLAMLELLLQHGVTTIRDPGSETEAAVTLRDLVNRGEVRGPRIYTAGRILNQSAFNPEPFLPVRTADDVRREIRWQKAAGVDLIKIYSSMTPELAKVAIDEAHALGLPIIGHLQRTTWTEAAKLGIDGIEHFAPWAAEYLPASKRDAYPQSMFGRVYWLQHVDVNGPEIAEMIAAMKAHGVVLDPTLIALHTKFFGNNPRWLRNPDNALAPRAYAAHWAAGSFTKEWTAAQYAEAQRAWPRELALIRKIHEGGVRMVVGTDTPTPWIVPGTSVHDEMALLVSAGIPPAAVLEMATRNAARALKRERDFGSIAAGMRADLVVLSKNPLEKIEYTRSIEMVWQAGKRVR